MVTRVRLDKKDIEAIKKSLPRLRVDVSSIDLEALEIPKKVTKDIKAKAPLNSPIKRELVSKLEADSKPKLCTTCEKLYWQPCNGANTQCGNLQWIITKNNSAKKKAKK